MNVTPLRKHTNYKTQSRIERDLIDLINNASPTEKLEFLNQDLTNGDYLVAYVVKNNSPKVKLLPWFVIGVAAKFTGIKMFKTQDQATAYLRKKFSDGYFRKVTNQL